MHIERVRVRITPDGRLSREEAAKYLGLKHKTLHEWARLAKGPKPMKIGGRRFYQLVDIEAFIATGAREADA